MSGSGAQVPDPFDELDHATLASLVPELLLLGQLVDRAGMPALLGEFGTDGMRDVAIEEWEGASPHYTRRMKDALNITGDGVAEIFKGFQLDVGAPPEFMDFRYTATDHDHGSFHLDHCGALMDVEPMGDELVRVMCHDIEDPTFPATALATNPRARVEPVHRPPRVPAGRTPHCAWTVTIDPEAEPVPTPSTTAEMASAAAVGLRFPEPGPRPAGEAGTLTDYSGPLLADLRFADFTGGVLVRLCREVGLQIHLLALAFERAVLRRTDRVGADRLLREQCVGISGVASLRLGALPAVAGPAGDDPLDRAPRVLAVHPLFAPVHYTGARSERIDSGGGALVMSWDRGAPQFRDGGWARCLTADDRGRVPALEAAVWGVDPRLRVHVRADTAERLEVECVLGPDPVPEPPSVALTRLSSGADFVFGAPRPLLPLHPLGT